MSEIEDFILERSFDGGAMTDHEEVVSVADLRELFKGKVLVDAKLLERIYQSACHFGISHADIIACEKLLHPTSEDKQP